MACRIYMKLTTLIDANAYMDMGGMFRFNAFLLLSPLNKEHVDRTDLVIHGLSYKQKRSCTIFFLLYPLNMDISTEPTSHRYSSYMINTINIGGCRVNVPVERVSFWLCHFELETVCPTLLSQLLIYGLSYHHDIYLMITTTLSYSSYANVHVGMTSCPLSLFITMPLELENIDKNDFFAVTTSHTSFIVLALKFIHW